MSEKVAILGSGPAAIYAARACFDRGVACRIYTTHKAWLSGSFPPGAFYLHQIPLTVVFPGNSSEPIHEVSTGTEHEYIQSQWGILANKVKQSSFPNGERIVHGFSATTLPNILPTIVPMTSTSMLLTPYNIQDLSEKYDLVLQTFPTEEAKATQLPLQPFYVATYCGNHPEQELPYVQSHENYIYYRGYEFGIIVRISKLFGTVCFEFPKNMSIEEIKLRFTVPNCKFQLCYDLHPEAKPWTKTSRPNIHLIGRMATWDKTYLVHHSYSKVCGLLKDFTISP